MFLNFRSHFTIVQLSITSSFTHPTFICQWMYKRLPMLLCIIILLNSAVHCKAVCRTHMHMDKYLLDQPLWNVGEVEIICSAANNTNKWRARGEGCCWRLLFSKTALKVCVWEVEGVWGGGGPEVLTVFHLVKHWCDEESLHMWLYHSSSQAHYLTIGLMLSQAPSSPDPGGQSALDPVTPRVIHHIASFSLCVS